VRQLAFDDRAVGWREAEQAVDRISKKFGTDAVRPAALFGTGSEPGAVPVTDGSGHSSSNSRDLPRNLGNEPGI
jgi:DNA polymerase-4